MAILTRHTADLVDLCEKHGYKFEWGPSRNNTQKVQLIGPHGRIMHTLGNLPNEDDRSWGAEMQALCAENYFYALTYRMAKKIKTENAELFDAIKSHLNNEVFKKFQQEKELKGWRLSDQVFNSLGLPQLLEMALSKDLEIRFHRSVHENIYCEVQESKEGMEVKSYISDGDTETPLGALRQALRAWKQGMAA